MSRLKEKIVSTVKKSVEKSVVDDANSTTCFMIYQPKTPENLKKFSKIDNDK